MKISRLQEISHVTVSPEDIINITNKVYNEYKKSNSEDKRFEIILSCHNRIRYEFDNEDYHKGEVLTVLRNKKVWHITIIFRDFNSDDRISVDLEHSLRCFYSRDNCINVEGSNETWVTGTLELLNTIVTTWKKQPRIFSGNDIIEFLVWILIPAVTIIIGLIITLRNFGVHKSVLNLPGVAILISFLSLGLSFFIQNQLKALYPIVELLTGPEHFQNERSKRMKLFLYFSMYVLPLLLSSIYDFLKNI